MSIAGNNMQNIIKSKNSSSDTIPLDKNLLSEVSSLLHNDTNMPGYWIFRGSDRCFYFDERCSRYFGLQNTRDWVPELLVLECLSMRSVERFYRTMDTRDFGSVIFEDVEIIKGQYKGLTFVINGSVISRFNDGRAKMAVGHISNLNSSFAEFLSREIAGDGFFSWDSTSNILRFSSAYSSLLGYEEYEFPHTLAQWVETLVHPDDKDIVEVEKHIIASPNYGDSFEFCVRLKHKNGFYIWCIGRGIVIKRNLDGSAANLIGTLSDINLVQDNFENIKQMLYTDTLTGLKNRSYFQHHMVRWEDTKAQPVSVIYADVTGLKITNDVLGHADGDILLMGVTDILKSVIPQDSELMRLAGDEFLVIISNCDNQQCKLLLEQLFNSVNNHNKDPNIMPIFVGFGCATIGEIDKDTLHACIERADVRMQKYKDEHRKENYAQLKVYLEKRKGRPVSMRDGRRLEYLSNEERKAQNIKAHILNKTPY